MDYEPGTMQAVKMHDGPTIRLKKLDSDYDPTDKYAAMKLLDEAKREQEFITGLIYINEQRPCCPTRAASPRCHWRSSRSGRCAPRASRSTRCCAG